MIFQSPLLLDRYVVTEFSFTAHSDYDYTSDHNERIDLADLSSKVVPHQHKEDPLRWIFEITLELPQSQKKKYPYSFRIVLIGFFDVSPSYPAERAETLAQANAPALLYSAAREFLATVTGRGPFMALWLPSATFVKPPEASQLIPREAATVKSERKVTKKRKKKD